MDRPWPKHYDRGVPDRNERRAVGLHELLPAPARRLPDVLVIGGPVATRGELVKAFVVAKPDAEVVVVVDG